MEFLMSRINTIFFCFLFKERRIEVYFWKIYHQVYYKWRIYIAEVNRCTAIKIYDIDFKVV